MSTLTFTVDGSFADLFRKKAKNASLSNVDFLKKCVALYTDLEISAEDKRRLQGYRKGEIKAKELDTFLDEL